ncbi:hypothetical protein PYW08_004285 [Mythimna loreyi]|uniref:Uncharacterized protein n=1 Tax=Mythimna loreyi TaxID=667449 RepID=A0ACC2QP09_9NEOP|nr:hypothetical protein PYW08_004285 [Mythimna loreyi]
MEADDDMIVLVVVDDDEKAKSSEKDFSISTPSATCIEVDNIIETAQKHGEYITVKIEPQDDDFQYEYLEDGITSEPNVKEELKEEVIEQDDGDEEYFPEEESSNYQHRNRHRFAMLKPWQQRSFVAELREQYEELREDEDLLINTLGRIMRTVKPPPPPPDFFIMNGIMFECVCCGYILDTLPAANRHFQEKHGQRYLVCYACGVDFRSTTNLYKHEKRCIAPDAEIVLRARAVFLGRKGRGRPFLTLNKFATKRNKFPCSLCSAVFISKSNLESHENLHRGERPYRCHACPCAYTSYSALSRHAKKHTDAQFICDHCSRSFKVKAALVAHMDTHKPMRKHGCEECNRRFAQKSALMLHVNRVHRNLPPPCACQICPKRYPRMSLLKAHMKRAHGMSIITRKMFFKTLPTMTELEIKESKVILKYEENEMLAFPPRPIKAEPEPTEEFNYEQEYAEVTNEMEEETKATEEMAMADFMQYVSHGVQDPGNNVVYIQNGEVVQSFNSDRETSDSNFYLEVEALVDGQIIVKSCTEGNSL